MNRSSGDWRIPEGGCTWTASGDWAPWERHKDQSPQNSFLYLQHVKEKKIASLYLTMRKHIFSRGNSLGPSTPSSWPSVSRYTSKQTHRREIWLVRSWWPGWGPCSSLLNTFTSLSMALQKKQRKPLVFHHPHATCGGKPPSPKQSHSEVVVGLSVTLPFPAEG